MADQKFLQWYPKKAKLQRNPKLEPELYNIMIDQTNKEVDSEMMLIFGRIEK